LLGAWSGWKRRLQIAQVCAGFSESFSPLPFRFLPAVFIVRNYRRWKAQPQSAPRLPVSSEKS
jgi:hypothetical protein